MGEDTGKDAIFSFNGSQLKAEPVHFEGGCLNGTSLNDSIKKVEPTCENLHTSSIKDLTSDEEVKEQPMVEPSARESTERLCRICFGGEEEASLGRLISPCKCKGTMKYVHLACLNAWRNASNSRGLSSESSFFKCSSCLYKYNFSRTWLASLVTNFGVRFLLTLSILLMLVFSGGFCSKFILSKADFAIPNPETDITAEDFANLLDLTRIDWGHFVLGTIFVGVVGFILFLVQMVLWGTISVLGLRFPIFVYQRDGQRSGSRGKAEFGAASIFLLIIVVVGICQSLYTIYSTVNTYSKRWLEALGAQILEVEE